MRLSRVLAMTALALSGCLVIPIAAYVVGGRVVGPYAGSRGLATYINAIYSDAAAGSPLALVLVAGPVLIVVVWRLRRWLLSRLLPGRDAPARPQ